MTPRVQCLDRLRSSRTWDLAIIGGGATGLGTAVDAALRGYSTLLIEADDFAKGTSSRSTKLVHGGVRYLAQGRLSLVREALLERGRLLRNAPHLVHTIGFLIPAYKLLDRPYYAAGLWAYDRLASDHDFGHSRMISRDEALTLAPTLEPHDLRGGVFYRDGQFDDARLAIALARTADDAGATVLNRVAARGFLKDPAGRITGLEAVDAETGECYSVSARAVVNATGVFADRLRTLDDPSSKTMIAPSQGAHIVLDRDFLPGATAILIPKTDDGRVLFAIPWHGSVIVGTTDTPVSSVDLEPRPLPEELAFLIQHAGRYLARAPKPSDVRAVFAGLRPLIAGEGSTASLSREHTTLVSPSGLITITGGKWTTYRAMAEAAVDLAANRAGLPFRPCPTPEHRLHGATDSPPFGPFAIYGSDAPALARLESERPEFARSLHPRLPVRETEVVWAAREESARTVEDVLARRTRALFLDAAASIESAPRVAALLAAELGRDAAWQAAQAEAYRSLAAGYLFPD